MFVVVSRFIVFKIIIVIIIILSMDGAIRPARRRFRSRVVRRVSATWYDSKDKNPDASLATHWTSRVVSNHLIQSFLASRL